MQHREVFYGSPAVGGLDSGDEVTATVTFNERTVADLSRLCAWASVDALVGAVSGYAGQNLVNALEVSDLTIYGSDLLMVGRNSPTSGLPLAADRFVGAVRDHRFNLSRFGRLPFSSSDTIALTASVTPVGIQGSFGIAVPGTSNLMADQFRPSRPPQYLGNADVTTLAAGAAGTLTITADRAGWVPLSDLTISALQLANAAGAVGNPNIMDALGSIYITQIELPGSDLLVRGTGTATVPAAAFSANRSGSIIDFGGCWLDAGSAIQVSVVNRGIEASTVYCGVPFFANEQKGAC